jgi:hypothetical protein
VAVADVNSDGTPDLIVTNEGSSNSVIVLLGHRDGSFAAQITFPVGSIPNSVAVSDLNGDGNRDPVTLNESGNNLSVLLGMATKPSPPRRRWPSAPAHIPWQWPM